MIYSITATSVIFISFFVTAYFFQKMNFLPQITTSSIGKRYYFIDGLRGIAAISVVVGHSWRLGVKGFNLNDYSINSASLIAALGVQIFFCITGFLFVDQIIKKKSTFDWEKFFLSRIKRLTPLFFFSTTICLMILYTVNFDKLRDLSLDDIGNSLKLYLFGFSGNQKILGMDSNVLTIMTWTLPYEWRFYMALPLFCVLTKIIKFHSPVLFLLLFIFVFFPVCGSHFGKYFFTGCLSAVLFNKYEIKNNSTRIIVFLLGNASLIGSFFINGDYYGNTIFIFISVFFLSLVVSKPVFLSNKLFIYCGETSYSIYLCHTIFIVGVSYLVYLLFGVTDVNSYTSILIYSISALLIAVFSFFSYKYIEYPFLKK